MNAEQRDSSQGNPGEGSRGQGEPTQSRRRRGTPISDGLGADLNALGSILANHTRGLDDFLQRQGARIEERHQSLLAESAELLLPGGLDLEAMSTRELQSLCRARKLRGWSKLRRENLLAFLHRELGASPMAPGPLEDGEPPAGTRESAQAPATPDRSDATRTERLLLLLLSHLGVPQELVEAAWTGGVRE